MPQLDRRTLSSQTHRFRDPCLDLVVDYPIFISMTFKSSVYSTPVNAQEETGIRIPFKTESIHNHLVTPEYFLRRVIISK